MIDPASVAPTDEASQAWELEDFAERGSDRAQRAAMVWRNAKAKDPDATVNLLPDLVELRKTAPEAVWPWSGACPPMVLAPKFLGNWPKPRWAA
jgi:hypothetical protein